MVLVLKKPDGKVGQVHHAGVDDGYGVHGSLPRRGSPRQAGKGDRHENNRQRHHSFHAALTI